MPRPGDSLRFLLAAPVVVALAGNPLSAQTITVDTTLDRLDFGGAQTLADLPGPDGSISLREAVTDYSSSRNGAGSGNGKAHAMAQRAAAHTAT